MRNLNPCTESAVLFRRMSGLSDISKGAAKAETQSENTDDAYSKEFSSKGIAGHRTWLQPNGERFNTPRNTYERGMYAFLMRNVVGDNTDAKMEFDRRTSLVKESIDYLTSKKATKEEQKKGELYKLIADELHV